MKLSIITINYNNAEGLRKTLASVAAQTYPNIEHIIVDGNSTDNSVDVLETYKPTPSPFLKEGEIDASLKSCAEGNTEDYPHQNPAHKVIWVSEQDKGIYNAMNKGIEIALGKRVVNDDHTSQPILNPSLNQPTPNPFLKEGEHASFAKTWGAHTADSTQYDLLKENAKANRTNPTEAESAMWDILKGNNIGYHFRRQHIILDYIVDFICLEKGLVIELDGGYHNDSEQKEYDERRTAHLQRLGYTELRFKNEELLCAPDSVIQKITETLEQLPSLQGGAGGRLSSLPFREGQGGGSHYIQILNSGDILAAPDVTERMMAALAAQCAEAKGDEEVKGNENGEADTPASRLSPLASKLTSDSAPASSLSPFASRLENCPAIFYGNMIKEYPDGRRVVDRCQSKDYTPESFYYFYRGTLNHDCAYIRRDLFEKYGLYNEDMKICSDWEWYVRAIVLGGEKTVYTNIDVTVFDMTGISESDGRNRALIQKERREYLESILPTAVLRDYDMLSLPIEQYRRLKKYHLWGIVYFVERVLFKFEKWFKK